MVYVGKNMIESTADNEDVARLQKLFQSDTDLLYQLEAMAPENRKDICYLVSCVIRDLKGCCKHILLMRKQLASYNKMSDKVDPSNQFQVIAEQICSVMDCEKVVYSFMVRVRPICSMRETSFYSHTKQTLRQ